jgi:hypothetical protein
MRGSRFRQLMAPLDFKFVHVCGKGGREGQCYMMSRAIDMLQLQGHSGDRDSILIIGDRHDPLLASELRPLIATDCHWYPR